MEGLPWTLTRESARSCSSSIRLSLWSRLSMRWIIRVLQITCNSWRNSRETCSRKTNLVELCRVVEPASRWTWTRLRWSSTTSFSSQAVPRTLPLPQQTANSQQPTVLLLLRCMIILLLLVVIRGTETSRQPLFNEDNPATTTIMWIEQVKSLVHLEGLSLIRCEI